MAQAFQQHYRQLVQADTQAVEYDLVTAGGAGTKELIEQFVIVNNDAISQTVTVRLNIAGSTARLTMAYTIAAGASEFPTEFMNQVLEGDGSNPDTITVAFSDALGALPDSIDCFVSAVRDGI